MKRHLETILTVVLIALALALAWQMVRQDKFEENQERRMMDLPPLPE